MRAALRLTSREMGALVGRTHQTVLSWEAEKTSPRISDLAAFDHYGLNATRFVTGYSDEMFSKPIEQVLDNVRKALVQEAVR